MSDRKSSSGVGFLGLLALLFIGLKLGGVIDWSWWWVLAPIWIKWAVLVPLMILVAVGEILEDSTSCRPDRRR